MPNLTLLDVARRKMAKGFRSRNKFKPGGTPGKLHRELGISTDEKIPAARLEAAAHSKNREVRNDAIRAQTMKKWHHTGPKKKSRGSVLYDRKKD